jgi:hypothetical protein
MKTKYLVLNEYLPNNQIRQYVEMYFDDMEKGIKKFESLVDENQWSTDDVDSSAGIVDYVDENGDIINDVRLSKDGFIGILHHYNWPHDFIGQQ